MSLQAQKEGIVFLGFFADLPDPRRSSMRFRDPPVVPAGCVAGRGELRRGLLAPDPRQVPVLARAQPEHDVTARQFGLEKVEGEVHARISVVHVVRGPRLGGRAFTHGSLASRLVGMTWTSTPMTLIVVRIAILVRRGHRHRGRLARRPAGPPGANCDRCRL